MFKFCENFRPQVILFLVKFVEMKEISVPLFLLLATLIILPTGKTFLNGHNIIVREMFKILFPECFHTHSANVKTGGKITDQGGQGGVESLISAQGCGKSGKFCGGNSNLICSIFNCNLTKSVRKVFSLREFTFLKRSWQVNLCNRTISYDTLPSIIIFYVLEN